MSKKDFEHIANILYTAGCTMVTRKEKLIHKAYISKFANEFSYHYPRFDKGRFMQMVGWGRTW